MPFWHNKKSQKLHALLQVLKGHALATLCRKVEPAMDLGLNCLKHWKAIKAARLHGSAP